MEDLPLRVGIALNLALLDCEEHRRAWRKIKRHVIPKRSPCRKRCSGKVFHLSSFTPFLDMLMGDAHDFEPLLLPQPIAAKKTAPQNSRQVSDVRDVGKAAASAKCDSSK